ncbi:uncharacterized protein VTP21DRAFT_1132 [Calcarisporiella thermophila]|uniref:uncharacterized protein n=1 Tax=Calcarisporiella thermophila TaxID=911321 RepID=UPI003742F115
MAAARSRSFEHSAKIAYDSYDSIEHHRHIWDKENVDPLTLAFARILNIKDLSDIKSTNVKQFASNAKHKSSSGTRVPLKEVLLPKGREAELMVNSELVVFSDNSAESSSASPLSSLTTSSSATTSITVETQEQNETQERDQIQQQPQLMNSQGNLVNRAPLAPRPRSRMSKSSRSEIIIQRTENLAPSHQRSTLLPEKKSKPAKKKYDATTKTNVNTPIIASATLSSMGMFAPMPGKDKKVAAIRHMR